MKKAFIYIIACTIIAVSFYGCKKEHPETADQPATSNLHPVTFNVSGISIDPGQPITGNNSKLATNATVSPADVSGVSDLYYLLYNTSGTLIRKKDLYTSSSTFNPIITDSLKSGSYVAAFVTGYPYAIISADGQSLSYSYYDYGNFPETFYKKVNFTVGSTALNQNVILTRVTSELQVVIKDAIPAIAKSISIDVSADRDKLMLFADTVKDRRTGVEPSRSMDISSETGVTNFATTPIPLLNSVLSMTVTITVKGTNKQSLYSRTVSNVTFKRNTRTILTGNLFTNPSGGGNGFDLNFSRGFTADSTKINF